MLYKVIQKQYPADLSVERVFSKTGKKGGDVYWSFWSYRPNDQVIYKGKVLER